MASYMLCVSSRRMASTTGWPEISSRGAAILSARSDESAARRPLRRTPTRASALGWEGGREEGCPHVREQRPCLPPPPSSLEADPAVRPHGHERVLVPHCDGAAEEEQRVGRRR